jgi:hypothetical protein
MEQTLAAVADPARTNAIVRDALDTKPAEGPKLPQADLPPDTIVTLLAGLPDPETFEMVKEAEVRELTGIDEEILGRIPPDKPERFFSTILKQGVVRLGQQKATPELLDDLLIGDRDLLMLKVRKATWGEHVRNGVYCAKCDEVFEYLFSVDTDIPIKPLDESDRAFTVEISNGRLVDMHLANGRTQHALLSLGKDAANIGAINTALLTSCVDRIDALAVAGEAPIRALTVRDRQKLLEALNERSFGPQLGEVSVLCQGCGDKLPAPLSLSTLFQV